MAGQLEKGTKIGPYEIKEPLGKGGMAAVYRAYQPSLERDVAIKVMAEQFTNDPSFAERFRREAKSIAKLRHPNILTVYDIGEDKNLLYIAMEVIEGETLRDEMRGKPLPIEKTLNYINQISSALDYANKAGIIHRDIKPSNVLLDKQSGRAVLSDFGIAKLADNSGNNHLTATGLGVGTPDYMSPEQAQGESNLDARSDQYSLGVMVYEMLTGHTPYTGDTPIAVVMGHITKPLPSPRNYNPEIPVAVENVLQHALAKRREDRYESTAAFNTALQSAWHDRNKPKNSTEEATQVLGTNPGISPRPPAGVGTPPPGQYGVTPTPNQYGVTPPPGQYGFTPPPNQYGVAPPPGQYGATPPPGQYGQYPAGGMPPSGQFGTQPMGQYQMPPNYAPNSQQLPTQQIYTPPAGAYVARNGELQLPQKKASTKNIIGAVIVILLVGIGVAFVFSGGDNNTKRNSTATAVAAARSPQPPNTPVPPPTQGGQPQQPGNNGGPKGPDLPLLKLRPYDDPEGYWSMDIPENWTPTSQDAGTSFEAKQIPGLGLLVLNEDTAEAGGTVSNEGLIELFVREFIKQSGGKLDRSEKRRVDGVDGTYYQGNFVKDSANVELRLVAIVKNNRFYAVILSVPQNAAIGPGKDRDLLFDRMIASFRAK